MKNLLESLDKLPQGWADRYLLLFLAFDGVLAPLTSNPTEAEITRENKDLLHILGRIPYCQTVITSGRCLADLRARVGLQAMDYVGNHGWEIDGPHLRFATVIPPHMMSSLEQISVELSTKLSDFNGVVIEDKGITLSVHHRLVPKLEQALVKKVFDQVCFLHLRHNRVKVHQGDKEWEVKPAIDWDKGKAASWFLTQQQRALGREHVLCIYIGDNSTDEDAFAELKGQAITVGLGKSRLSAAQYYLTEPAQVTKFLQCLTACISIRHKAAI